MQHNRARLISLVLAVSSLLTWGSVLSWRSFILVADDGRLGRSIANPTVYEIIPPLGSASTGPVDPSTYDVVRSWNALPVGPAEAILPFMTAFFVSGHLIILNRDRPRP
jgi:hypothetical protein